MKGFNNKPFNWENCKISKKRVNTFEQVINGDKIIDTKINLETGKEERIEYLDPNSLNAVVLTEEDLVNMTNGKLRRLGYKEMTIEYRTFKNYKRHIVEGNVVADSETEAGLQKFELMLKLKYIVEDAIAIQKARLFKNLTTGIAGNWQKYARIIERKYDSWNIKHKTEDLNETRKLGLAELAKNALEMQEEQKSITNSDT